VRSKRRRQVARRRAAALAVLFVVAAIAVAVTVGLSNGGGNATPKTTTRAIPPSPPPPRHHEKATKNEAAALEKRADAAVARFAALGLPLYCGGSKGRYVALTFDDGPGPATQRDVLPALRRYRARATFFLIGGNIAGYPSAPRQEEALGTVADHTWTHANLTALSTGSIDSELSRTKDAIRRATGRGPNLFRPPYGARNATVDAAGHSLGLLEVMWSIDSYDARGAKSWQEVAHNVLNNVQPGSIVLMHENLPTTVEALRREILRVLVHRKFELVTVGELLALDPPSTAQLRQGLEGCYGGTHTARLAPSG
jgi:peptidoglycan/xylan/chitin deacetylase (PgdA/CDA1 family)